LPASLSDLLTFVDLWAVDTADVFSSPRRTLDFIDAFDWVKGSGLAIAELDYLLNPRPDSPYGPRDDVVTQHVLALRDTLRSASAAQRPGQIASHVATTFSLTN